MPDETIESFVAKLQSEGVEAGKQAAGKLKAEAQKQADRIIEEAGTQAQKVVEEAKALAAGILDRSRTDLQLAARDTVLKLRETLSAALSAILARAADEKLSDVDFLGTVLHELILIYAGEDCHTKGQIRIDLRPDLRDKLVKWALKELGHEIGRGGNLSIDLKGRLSQAGFEYEISGATTEVTVESVVEVLSELIGPAIRDVLDKAMADYHEDQD